MATIKGFAMVRVGNSLVPDSMSPDALDGIKQGQHVLVDIKKPRNVEHHRKFFALLAVVYPHQSVWATQEQLREALLIAAGYSEEIDALVSIDGKKVKGKVWRSKSISFATMGQDSFTELYDRVVLIIIERILKNINKDELERQVHEILVGRK